MKNKNVMVIGAAGSLGFKLCESLIKNNYKVVGVDISENGLMYLLRLYNISIFIEDLQNYDKICHLIEENNIQLVINCAAMKHVRWCERNIKRSININILSNLDIIHYLFVKNKKYIYISSDKAIKPSNIYALTKQFTDYIIKKYNFKLIRGVNFLNSKGSVLEIWRKQKESNLPFTLVENKDVRRYFISVQQMVDLTMEAVQDTTDKIEYVPELDYDIGIWDLFEAYLKINNINNKSVNYISLLQEEKVIEDLNFNPKIIKLNKIDDICNLLKKNIKLLCQ